MIRAIDSSTFVFFFFSGIVTVLGTIAFLAWFPPREHARTRRSNVFVVTRNDAMLGLAFALVFLYNFLEYRATLDPKDLKAAYMSLVPHALYTAFRMGVEFHSFLGCSSCISLAVSLFLLCETITGTFVLDMWVPTFLCVKAIVFLLFSRRAQKHPIHRGDVFAVFSWLDAFVLTFALTILLVVSLQTNIKGNWSFALCIVFVPTLWILRWRSWYNIMLSIMVSFAAATLVLYKYGVLKLSNEQFVVGVPITMALFWTGVGVFAYRRDET